MSLIFLIKDSCSNFEREIVIEKDDLSKSKSWIRVLAKLVTKKWINFSCSKHDYKRSYNLFYFMKVMTIKWCKKMCSIYLSYAFCQITWSLMWNIYSCVGSYFSGSITFSETFFPITYSMYITNDINNSVILNELLLISQLFDFCTPYTVSTESRTGADNWIFALFLFFGW